MNPLQMARPFSGGDTSVFNLIGINGHNVKLVAPSIIEFPTSLVTDFPDACGAGSGIGQKIVPDTIWGIPVSPGCFIHDFQWLIAPPTWEAFHASNGMFHRNLNSLIKAQSGNSFMLHLRMYRAVTYFNAVDSVGADIFWALKKEQGEI